LTGNIDDRRAALARKRVVIASAVKQSSEVLSFIKSVSAVIAMVFCFKKDARENFRWVKS
jgi:uncharacterized membrane protein (UPF0127 family)